MLSERHHLVLDSLSPDRYWHPLLIHSRGRLEALLEGRLRDLTRDDVRRARETDGDFATRLTNLIDELDRGSLAMFLQRRASQEQFADFMRQRSIYHLKNGRDHV